MRLAIVLLLSSAALGLSGCAEKEKATPEVVVGTWLLKEQSPPVERTVTFNPDFTFVETDVQNGKVSRTLSGKWDLDGDGRTVWCDATVKDADGKECGETLLLWQLRPSVMTDGRLVVFGEGDPDGLRELTRCSADPPLKDKSK